MQATVLYPAARDDEVRGRVAEMFADTQFNYGVWQLARAMSVRAPQTWRYLFLRRRAGRLDGPNHGEEVTYVFNTLGLALAGQEVGSLRWRRLECRRGHAGGLGAVCRDGRSQWRIAAATGQPIARTTIRYLAFDDEIRSGAQLAPPA